MAPGALLKLLRPHQWVKNLFVAAPLVFARHLADWEYAVRAGLAVLAFCALSGAVYAFNDMRDAEADRAHPTKRHRPIAAGKISERTALVTSIVLAVGALAGSALLDWKVAAFAGAYLVQNIFYSIKLKQIAFLDVGLITTGFLLRVLAGAAAIGVAASGWCCCAPRSRLMLASASARTSSRGRSAAARRRPRAPRSPATGSVWCAARCSCSRWPPSPRTSRTPRAHTRAVFEPTTSWCRRRSSRSGSPHLTLALWRRDESPTEAMLRDPLFLIDLAAAGVTILYLIYS